MTAIRLNYLTNAVKYSPDNKEVHLDVSFRSAADVYEKELLCLLLSGGNADGAEGME
ncbi:MAG TPA: chemotaxis protein CheB [Puia sp.]|nr:chemotaxis protein CheB [Puia sp.]